MFKRKCCVVVISLISLIGVIGLAILYVWSIGAQRNEKLLSGRYDALMAQELNQMALPTVDAIVQYNADHQQYPDNLAVLVPNYVLNPPSKYLGGRVVYTPRPSYGVPFYFGFSGNYSGSYFMHGWGIVYCPVSLCELSDPRRLDDNWIFIHSSAL